MSDELDEYKQLLQFLSSSQPTQVLAPVDGDGREFWVHAVADPENCGEIELEIDGKTRTCTKDEALVLVKQKIAELEKK